MRIISQDKETDIPYEQSVLTIGNINAETYHIDA